MPAFSTLILLGAFWGVADVGQPAPDDALPGGNAAAFRQRIADRWPPDPVSAPPVAPRLEQAAVALPRLSSGFGYRVDPISGARTLHAGIDIPGPSGSPIRAAATGTIDYAGRAGGYGNMIEIDHGGGLSTRYAHLLRFLVNAGTHVERGQPIALMGSTGHSTGSHLHFEVRVNGRPAAPLGWFGGDQGTVRTPEKLAAPHISAFAQARADASHGTGF
jgi:murein DD-endopeptidase MepM/ murein hydrolase activator NlpD